MRAIHAVTAGANARMGRRGDDLISTRRRSLRHVVAFTAVALSTYGCALFPLPSGDAEMSFFLTSRNLGNGGDLGGLAGADAHCAALASAAGSQGREWRAYLSASAVDGQPDVHARDRIGSGPWFNARGAQVAADVDDLHALSNELGARTSLDEDGQTVAGGIHDILTGSNPDGTLAGDTATCSNWTSASPNDQAMLGHHNRRGGGDRPDSWNAAHLSRGCDLPSLAATAGDARFYCFAVD